jgi:hypothetical protein
MLKVGFQLSAVDDRHSDLSESLHRFQFAHDVRHLERFFLQVIQEAITPSILRACGLRLALDTLLLKSSGRSQIPKPPRRRAQFIQLFLKH